ncbi:MAG: hypothetical protein H8E15_04515 [Planctomycetes bacterium]|nr:hypothetical protein [Planctomycetota bacterium]
MLWSTRIAAIIGLVAFTPSAMAQRGDVEVRRASQLDYPEQAPSVDQALDRLDRNQPWIHAADAHAPRFSSSGRPAILLTGYWPPTNEGVRKFSPDPVQNPGGWQGSNWENRGYDVYSYFPEFNPPDCANCGKGHGDLEVDYQDTSLDFWPIAWNIRPIAVITFSRGSWDNSWEVEINQYNRTYWIPDYLDPRRPTPEPPDDTRADDALIESSLPVQDIVDAVNQAGLGINGYVNWTGDGGGFLSEFIAYHGVWYRENHASPADPDWCVAAGHVHVGHGVSWPKTILAVDITLRTVADYVDTVVAATVCQTDLGFGGPGAALLTVCGDPLASGGNADLMVSYGPPEGVGVLLAGTSFQPTPWHGGTVVPVPVWNYRSFRFDPNGRWLWPQIGGGLGPISVYTQAVYRDASQPQGYGFSNAIRVDFLP